jgi:hypothetical protein
MARNLIGLGWSMQGMVPHFGSQNNNFCKVLCVEMGMVNN